MPPLGKECPSRFTTSDWDDKEDKNTKEKGQNEQPEASPKWAIVMPTQTLQPSKPYITKYFDNMLNNPPIRFTPRDRRRHKIIVALQELNETVWENPQQDPLEEIDKRHLETVFLLL